MKKEVQQLLDLLFVLTLGFSVNQTNDQHS